MSAELVSLVEARRMLRIAAGDPFPYMAAVIKIGSRTIVSLPKLRSLGALD